MIDLIPATLAMMLATGGEARADMSLTECQQAIEEFSRVSSQWPGAKFLLEDGTEIVSAHCLPGRLDPCEVPSS